MQKHGTYDDDVICVAPSQTLPERFDYLTAVQGLCEEKAAACCVRPMSLFFGRLKCRLKLKQVIQATDPKPAITVRFKQESVPALLIRLCWLWSLDNRLTKVRSVLRLPESRM